MFLLLNHFPPEWPLVLTALIGGYLSGSVPYGLILTRLAGMEDIRKSGSGNIGATNVLRLGGARLGVLTLILDALKGAVPVLIAKHFGMDQAILAALAAFLGHLFPVWLKFRGGKGVAVAIGVTFALSWKTGLGLCGVWLLIAGVSGYSSLAALIAFAVAPLMAGLLTGDLQIISAVFLLAVMIWVRHHQNIRRLIAGTEGKINLGKKA